MISVEKMRILEDLCEVLGVSRLELMENAGTAAAEIIKKKFPKAKICVVCYHGNNGGDGFVVARKLAKTHKVNVLFLGKKESLKDEGLTNFKKLDKALFIDQIPSCDVIVDAMLGTGIKGKLKEPLLSSVNKINSMSSFKISLDIPTGNLDADLVVAFHAEKLKLDCDVAIADIGIPYDVDEVTKKLFKNIPKRPLDSHKGVGGRILIVGGSKDLVGAPLLAAQAVSALRTGADLVTLAAPSRIAWVANTLSLDIMTKKLDGDFVAEKHLDEINTILKKSDVLLIGPGLGLNPSTKKLVNALCKTSIPKVIDADAIKSIDLHHVKNAILTPHVKEFEILLKNSELTRKNFRACLGSNVLLLKGKTDFIIGSDVIYFNTTGNPGMTVGGTGDVLAGMCSGFLVQSLNLALSACLGAYLCGALGDSLRTKQGYGFIASDFIPEISRMLGNFIVD